MLNAKVIGIGAAGNKAAIALVEQGVMDKNDVILLNTTIKDIPVAYQDLAVCIEGSHKGCGKERNIANEMIMENLRNNKIALDGILDKDDKIVIIVTSLEGGTGCGASTVIAKYFSDVLNANVHLFAFAGFEEDVRGLKNTVDWFNELSEKYVVECISNRKFLKSCYNNKLKAEKAANNEFVSRIRILLGRTIVESEQNIDDTDLYKLDMTKGFMTIETANINKIKNVEECNKILIEAMDNSKSLDVEATCKRIGVIVNVHEKEKDNIDYMFEAIKERYGAPFETFTHVQDVHEQETITFIITGLKMPIDDVTETYNNYIARMDQVDKSKDEFFEKSFSTDSDGFDMDDKKLDPDKILSNRAAFFGNTSKEVKTSKGTVSNIQDQF